MVININNNDNPFKGNTEEKLKGDNRKEEKSDEKSEEIKEKKSDKIDTNEDKTIRNKESKFDQIDWNKKETSKNKESKFDQIDWNQKETTKKKESKFDLIDWSQDQPKKRETEEPTKVIADKNDSDIKNEINSEQIEKIEDENDKITDIPEDKYTTLDLIEGLKEKLQQRSEELAQIFPDRVNKYSQTQLSRLWRNNDDFVHKVSYLYNKEGHYNIRDSTVDSLRQKIIQKYGEQRSANCIQTIERFDQGEINIFAMTEQIRLELGKISGEIPVTNQELSQLFGRYSGYIKEVGMRIKNINKKDYNPDFKFSIEQLKELTSNLGDILKKNSKKCSDIIDKYEKANPDLKDYSHEQTTITNKHAFAEISDKKTSYWFGFMCADAHVDQKTYKIQFRLKTGDRERLEKFAKFTGYNINRIHDRVEHYRYKGELRQTNISSIQFVSKTMTKELYDNGFFSLSSEERKLPGTILSRINEAESISDNWTENESGRIALSYLLGFYDGDGNYRGGRSGRIYSSSRELLEEIKNVYKIKNDVHPLRPSLKADEIKEDSKYYISPGPKLLEQMFNTYKDSMQRKRIPDKLLNKAH
jgi:hypothetical protein